MIYASSLIVALLLSIQISAVDISMDKNTGEINQIRYDRESGNKQYWRAPAFTNDVSRRDPELESRSYANDPYPLLRSRKEYTFCKSYINMRPTVYKYKTITTCGNSQNCGTVTKTNEVIAKDPLTETVTEPTSTVTIRAAATTTITVTDAITITFTVGTPLQTPGPEPETLTVRDIKFPDCLRRYSPRQISSGCSKLVGHAIRTQTKTVTRSVRGNPTTKIVYATKTQTVQVTSTPVVTSTVIMTTVTEEARVTKTAVKTVCPQTTLGLDGIGVNSPGRVEELNTAVDEVECFSACFGRDGCNAWVYSAPGWCAMVLKAPPRDAESSNGCCPRGTGDWFWFHGARMDGSDRDRALGGRLDSDKHEHLVDVVQCDD